MKTFFSVVLKSYLSIFCFSSVFHAQAQEDNSLSTVAIGVVMPAKMKGIPEDVLPLLQAKMEAIVTAQGLSSDGYSANTFAIYPSIVVFGPQKTAGLMENFTTVKGTLSLILKQVNGQSTFSSLSKNITGAGASEQEATRNIFDQINPSDNDFAEFIGKAKTKIIGYYNQTCGNLIKKAESERMIRNYDEALRILLSVPVEATSCYDNAQAKAKAVFDELLMYKCKLFLQQARSFAAADNYDSALLRLSWIDPFTSCGTEAKTLISKIEKEVDVDKKKAWALLFQYYKTAGEIEKAKIKSTAIRSYASYNLLSQPTMIKYDMEMR